MGIPAGKPKTISVDLTGKFLSASREVRIVTNLCVYWDEIFLSEETAAPPVRMTGIQAAAADLHFRGFSTPVIHPQRKQPEGFEYEQWMPVSMWNPTKGLYTRYGDVLPLIGAIDDRLVIMGSGDELRLLFPARAVGPLPAGWKRDFLLFVDGWAKDADANTAFGRPWSRCRSTPCRSIRIRRRSTFRTMRRTGTTGSSTHPSGAASDTAADGLAVLSCAQLLPPVPVIGTFCTMPAPSVTVSVPV